MRLIVRNKLILIVFTSLFITGCASTAMRNTGLDKLAPRHAEQELSAGINHYDNGDYQTATRELQTAIIDHLAFKSDQVTAHKYLAFIDCISARKKLCADEFKKAITLDPDFKLSAAEAGHPIWGPVYRRVKKEASQARTK